MSSLTGIGGPAAFTLRGSNNLWRRRGSGPAGIRHEPELIWQPSTWSLQRQLWRGERPSWPGGAVRPSVSMTIPTCLDPEKEKKINVLVAQHQINKGVAVCFFSFYLIGVCLKQQVRCFPECTHIWACSSSPFPLCHPSWLVPNTGNLTSDGGWERKKKGHFSFIGV